MSEVQRFGKTGEVRLNEDGSVDEIVASGPIHIEQMSEGQWWMSIGDGDTSIRVVFTSTTGAEIVAIAETIEGSSWVQAGFDYQDTKRKRKPTRPS